jgi:molybdopterin-guanine dinucleotide biosynthesis protein A
VAEDLASVTVGPTVVAAVDGSYDDLGLETIGDAVPGRGPLGGLATALSHLPRRHSGMGWVLLVACDLVGVESAWVEALTERTEGARAVAFRSPTGWEPLFALYHRSLGAIVDRRLEGEDRSLRGLLDEVGAVGVGAPPGLRQITTPGDLEQLRGS